MATDTSVTAAISERVLGECMQHLQYGGALEHGPPNGGVPVTPITGPLRRMHRHKRQGIEASTRRRGWRPERRRLARLATRRYGREMNGHVVVRPNESRLRCSTLKKDSFHNLRAPYRGSRAALAFGALAAILA